VGEFLASDGLAGNFAGAADLFGNPIGESRTWLPMNLYGTARRVLRVALVRDFDEARLFGVRFYAERVRKAVAPHCDVADVYPWPRAAHGPSAMRVLQTLLVKEILYPLSVRGLAPDVAHLVDQSHAHLLRRLSRSATVVSCHDLWGLRFGGTLRRAAYRRRVRSLREANRVIAVSESARREALALGVSAERISLVRNRVDRFFLGIPDACELASTCARLRVEPRAFVLHVGNNLPYKNLDGLIRALGEVRRTRGSVGELVKVGAEPSAVQRRLAAGEGVVMRWVGEISPVELRALYHLARCLVYPSFHEGFCWPVAEALACGLPVVSGRDGALPEVAGDAAILVNPASVSEIAAAVARVCDDRSLRDELGAKGRARGEWLAEGDFGAELVGVYRAAVEEKRDA
jgi:glycosyltransferase involved in cell wall biosynthesis